MKYLELSGGARLAYRRAPGRGPGVVFLSGFMSDMQSRKAHALEAHCRSHERAFLCFDYQGHGASDGSIVDLDLSAWIDDALAMLDSLTTGPQVLVGSSMGAWIMTRCLELRAARVAAALGVAAAPDFTETLAARLDETQKSALADRGACEIPTPYADRPYVLTQRMLDSGRVHAVLGRTIPCAGPVILLHGLADSDVPWSRSVALGAVLDCEDLEVRLLRGADHRLSSDAHLERIVRTLDELMSRVSRPPSTG